MKTRKKHRRPGQFGMLPRLDKYKDLLIIFFFFLKIKEREYFILLTEGTSHFLSSPRDVLVMFFPLTFLLATTSRRLLSQEPSIFRPIGTDDARKKKGQVREKK